MIDISVYISNSLRTNDPPFACTLIAVIISPKTNLYASCSWKFSSFQIKPPSAVTKSTFAENLTNLSIDFVFVKSPPSCSYIFTLEYSVLKSFLNDGIPDVPSSAIEIT